MEFRLLAALLLLAPAVQAQDGAEEVERNIEMSVIDVVTARKPLYTSVAGDELHGTSPKDISTLAANFYAPDYGSRTTSAMYVRGLGSRMSEPVVGLVVDGVSILSKDAYDVEMMDILYMDVKLAPNPLNGPNSMAGRIEIETLSPLHYEGTRLGIEYGNGNTGRYRASAYMRLNKHAGLSIGGYYSHSDGFFENLYNGEKCDWQRSGGGRVKFEYEKSGLHITNTLALSNVNQGGYPYKSIATDSIAYNDPCGYRRFLLTDGVKIEKSWGDTKLASTTSYQYLDDELTLDNDFSPAALFTLTQARREHALTQEFSIIGRHGSTYHWITGAFGFYRHADTEAPVSMGDAFFHSVMPPTAPTLAWNGGRLAIDSRFSTPRYGAAVYHESYWELNRHWTLEAALRLDYEAMSIDYRNRADAAYQMTLPRPGMPPVPGTLEYDSPGRLKRDFMQILPRIGVAFRPGYSGNYTLYASVSEGHKSGGFNTQMFSEIVQQEVMEQMMNTEPTMTASEIITYKPEQSWNYEIGTRLSGGRYGVYWNANLSLFYIDVRDQQLTIFPPGQTTGRMMTNAGRSRSFGGEFLGNLNIKNFDLYATYGYTNAKFTRYTNGNNDYAGKYVPYAPQHTLSASATYNFNLGKKNILTLGLSTNGAGKIYWNEENSVEQPFYALLNGSIRFSRPAWNVELWAKNLTNTHYDVFHFILMGNSFLQQGMPRTFGISLNLNLQTP